ncbi:uncharacterized protein LOC116256343 [Nymphaea colorata]|nr:uncharacterized protein LOC116256343 [Nymphaea colorata]
MVAARKESVHGFDEEEELYEKIEAPKWVDFTTPSKCQPADDYEWFCLRAGCKQNHDEALDPATLSANFLRRVMEARSPIVRLGKDSRLLTPKAIAKCPLSAPAKAAKSRIPRWNDINRKKAPERVVRQLIPAAAEAAASPQHVTSAKAVTTPSHKKCQNTSGAFRSVRSSKVVISVKRHTKSAAKALVFHSPRKISKPAKQKSATPSRVHAETKKLEVGSEGNGSLAVGHLCKSSRCAANDPNYNTPVSVPLKTRLCARKLKTEQQGKAICLNPINPEVPPDVRNQHMHQQEHPFDEERIIDQNSVENEKKSGPQGSSDERSSGSVDMEIDGNSRHGSLEVCSEMKCSVRSERKERGEKLPAELAVGESDIQDNGVAESPHKKTSINLVKHDSGPSASGDGNESSLAETQAQINAVNVTKCSETRDTNCSHDLTSEVAECMAKCEHDKPHNQEPQVTLTPQKPTTKEGSMAENAAEKLEETTGITSVADNPKEKTLSKHQNEKRQGMNGSLKRSNKKRSANILIDIPIPDQDSERKDVTTQLSNMTLDDFDSDANKENTSTSANSNIISVNKSEKRLGKKIAYEIPKKILEIAREKVPQGSASATRMEHKTIKLTNPKPFRFRTNERGILREANLEKRQQQPEASLDAVKKQTDLLRQGKYYRQTEQCKNGSVRKTQTASNMKVVKSRYLASGKTRQQKMEMTTQQTHKLDGEKLLAENNMAEKVKDQTSQMHQKQEELIREAKPRKKWNASTLPEKGNCDANEGLILPKQQKVESFEVSTESACTNGRCCSRGKRHPTIPKAPNFHNTHIPKTCCAKKSAN